MSPISLAAISRTRTKDSREPHADDAIAIAKMKPDQIEGHIAKRYGELFTAAPFRTMPPPIAAPVGTRGNRNATHFAALAKSEGDAIADEAWRVEIEARLGR
jgi:hypothetical protein